MLAIKKESAWKFVTSSSGGLGIEFFAAEGGVIYLQNPAGDTIPFKYGAAGAGLSFGFKLPKIGKLRIPIKGKSAAGVIAPADFPNAGKIFILDTFAGDELTRSDITGVCEFLEIGGGLIAGGSGTAMLLGMNPVWLAAFLGGPLGMVAANIGLQHSATAILVMAGVTAGIQAGAGGAAFLGGLI